MFLDLTQCDFDDSVAALGGDDTGIDDVRAHPDILYLKNEKYVIIQTALEPFEDNVPNPRYRVGNMIAQRLRLKQRWRIIPLAALVGPAFVIPESLSQTDTSIVEHVLIKEKREWSDLFLQFER